MRAVLPSAPANVVPLWPVWTLAAAVHPFQANLGAFLKMFAAFDEADELVAPARGTNRLASFFSSESSAMGQRNAPRGVDAGADQSL